MKLTSTGRPVVVSVTESKEHFRTDNGVKGHRTE